MDFRIDAYSLLGKDLMHTEGRVTEDTDVFVADDRAAGDQVPQVAAPRGSAGAMWLSQRLRWRDRLDDPIPDGRAEPRILSADSLYRRLLAVADLVAAGVALLLAVSVIGDDRLTWPVLVALPLVILVSKVIRLYDRDEYRLHKTTLDEAPALFQAATLYALLIWLGESLLIEGSLGKAQVLGMWGLLFVSMVLMRSAARRLGRMRAGSERCLVLGDPRSAARIEEQLAVSHHLNAEIVGRVALSDERRKSGGPPLLGDVATLGLALAEHDIQRVIIVPRTSDSEEIILHAVRLSKSLGVKVSVLPRLFEVVGSSVEFDDLEGLTLLGVRRGGLSSSSRLLKRGFDVSGSAVGLLLLATVIVAVAAAVKLTSPGPVFFRQQRIGRDASPFLMTKFRSMVDGAEAMKDELRGPEEAAEGSSGLFKMVDDPRVTPLGVFLRRTCLDELPQLFNVLRGDMSLVGPRPLVPDEDGQVEGWQRSRLELPPGMTGFWQILPSSRVPLEEMVKIDYLYGANWSLWLDVKILLRTIPYALARGGL